MAIGVSIASYLPWSALSAAKAAWWAQQAGYAFLQALPLRSVASDIFVPLPVRYVEDAWNPAYTARGRDPKTPITWVDRLFFPRRSHCVRAFTLLCSRGATVITHRLDEALACSDVILEVHPGLWRTPEELREVLPSQRLCLDLYHLRRGPRPDELAHRPSSLTRVDSLLGPWQEALRILCPAARVVHVSPHRRDPTEVERFLAGDRTELEDMLAALRGFRGDLVVELKQPLRRAFRVSRLRDLLARFREQLTGLLRAFDIAE